MNAEDSLFEAVSLNIPSTNCHLTVWANYLDKHFANFFHVCPYLVNLYLLSPNVSC